MPALYLPAHGREEIIAATVAARRLASRDSSVLRRLCFILKSQSQVRFLKLLSQA
jgi:hypothetical protein